MLLFKLDEHINEAEKKMPDLEIGHFATGSEKALANDDKSTVIMQIPPFPCNYSDNLNHGNAMSDSKGFYKIPRSLTDDVRFTDAPLSYQAVLMRLIEYACYKPQEFNDHGNIITLQPGQICISHREFAKKCGKRITSKNVERCISYFEKHQILGHEVRHRKTIVTFIRLDICECFKKTSEAASGARVGQEWGINKEDKKIRTKEKKEKNIAQTAAPLRKEISFCFDSWSFQNIEPSDIETWNLLYPAVDVSMELVAMREWCRAKPAKSKSKKLWRNFIMNWLSKDNEKNINKQAVKDRYGKPETAKHKFSSANTLSFANE